jgi:hypothetical protein
MVGLGQGEKFLDIAQASARSAEAENESIMDGNGQIEPAQFEDHIVHWRIHVQAIQSLGYKQKAPPEIQKDMELHIMATEFFMMDHAVKNPAFAQQLSTLPMFPIFADFPAAPPMPPPMPTEQVEPSGPMTEPTAQPQELMNQPQV